MSTKIYNAYRVAPPFTLNDLLRLAKQSRESLIKQTRKRSAEQFQDSPSPDTFLGVLLTDVQQGYITANHSSLVVYPYGDFLAVQFFGIDDRNEALDWVEEHLIDAHWQNQTDQPEGITDYEWAQRESMWNDLLSDGAPSENGFSFDLLTQQEEISFIIEAYLTVVKGYDIEGARAAAHYRYAKDFQIAYGGRDSALDKFMSDITSLEQK